jgi:hypothetical protein
MILVESSFVQIPSGFEHIIRFEFEGRSFLARVIETQDETYVSDCYQELENLFPINIPKYFGEFSGDVFSFIYNNIQEGFIG